jgi:hypothetical protein
VSKTGSIKKTGSAWGFVLDVGAGTNVRVTSERLGHASVAFTLDVYGHVLPGQQADAAVAVAALVDGWPSTRQVERRTSERLSADRVRPPFPNVSAGRHADGRPLPDVTNQRALTRERACVRTTHITRVDAGARSAAMARGDSTWSVAEHARVPGRSK